MFQMMVEKGKMKVTGMFPIFNLRIDKLWLFICLTLSQTTSFWLFQTENICRGQFQIDKNGRKFSKQVENTAGKGEIACHEQFLLFPQCFHKTCTGDT